MRDRQSARAGRADAEEHGGDVYSILYAAAAQCPGRGVGRGPCAEETCK